MSSDDDKKQEANSSSLVSEDVTTFESLVGADVLQSVPVVLSVEVGRTQLKIRDLLRLKQGSVIELERNAGEPLDLLVNNTVVAQGEVVLVNDRYGVRLTRILPAEDRVEKL